MSTQSHRCDVGEGEMPLSLIESTSDLKSDDMDIVHGTKLAKIYEIRDGRNAWWSTWVTRYYPEKLSPEPRGREEDCPGYAGPGITMDDC